MPLQPVRGFNRYQSEITVTQLIVTWQRLPRPMASLYCAVMFCLQMLSGDFASQRVKFHFSGLTDSLGVPAFSLRAWLFQYAADSIEVLRPCGRSRNRKLKPSLRVLLYEINTSCALHPHLDDRHGRFRIYSDNINYWSWLMWSYLSAAKLDSSSSSFWRRLIEYPSQTGFSWETFTTLSSGWGGFLITVIYKSIHNQKLQ